MRPCLDIVHRALAGALKLPHLADFGQTCARLLGNCGAAPDAVAVCTVDGQQWRHGDAETAVCLQELAHCVTYLAARDQLGRSIHDHIGPPHHARFAALETMLQGASTRGRPATRFCWAPITGQPIR